MHERFAYTTESRIPRLPLRLIAALLPVCVACLFVFGQELSSYGLIVAALLAIVLPRYLERAWRCKLNTARMAMIVAMAIGLAIIFVVTGMRHGFSLKAQ